VGTRVPAHATSMGHVLLAGLSPAELDAYLSVADLAPLTSHTITSPEALRAELDKVRAQGWALVDQELEDGLRSVAAPVRDTAGRVTAAVNVSSHASRTTLDRIRREILPAVLHTCERIDKDLTAGTRKN